MFGRLGVLNAFPKKASHSGISPTERGSYVHQRHIKHVPSNLIHQFSSVQLLSHVQLFVTPMDCRMPGFPVLHYVLKLAQTHFHLIGYTMQSSHALSPLFLLPSIFPITRIFSNESNLCIRWPKYWSFSSSICPSNEYSGLIYIRID